MTNQRAVLKGLTLETMRSHEAKLYSMGHRCVLSSRPQPYQFTVYQHGVDSFAMNVYPAQED